MKTSMRSVCRGDFVAVFASSLLIVVAPIRAYAQSVQVTGKAGIASVSDRYQSNCGHASLAYSLDVQGRQRIFPQLSLDHFSGSGGGDVLCLPVSPTVGTAVGGLRLEGATRASVGVGGRVGNRYAQLEGVVLGGMISGRRGFDSAVGDDSRHLRPQVGGQVGIVLFRYVVLAGSMSWTKLTLNVTPSTGGAVYTESRWAPMGTMQIGIRVNGAR